MSVFGNVIRRADGVEERAEDNRIYHECPGGWEEIESFVHEGFWCNLYTDGVCPAITIKIGMWEGDDRFFKFIDAKGKENVTQVHETFSLYNNSFVNFLSIRLDNRNERWTMTELRQTVYGIVKKLKEVR